MANLEGTVFIREVLSTKPAAVAFPESLLKCRSMGHTWDTESESAFQQVKYRTLHFGAHSVLSHKAQTNDEEGWKNVSYPEF